MDGLIDKVVDILLSIGVGILFLVPVAFGTFYMLKKENARRDKLEEDSKKKD